LSKNPSITGNKYKFPVERRKHKRIALDATVNSFILNGSKIREKLQIINISKEGICFLTSYDIKVGDLIEVYVYIPGSISIPIMVRIIWRGYRDESYAYGGQIIAINELYRGVLNSYIEKNL